MIYNEMRHIANEVRDIPLEAVLLLTGAKRDRYDKAKWHTCQGQVSVTGMKFMNWNQAVGGGGAIDLLMHLRGLGFKDAVQSLREQFPAFRRQIPLQPKWQFELPPEDSGNLFWVRRYLVQERGICLPLIHLLINAGRVYADTRCNAVFLLLGKGNTPVGAELRGTGSRPWRGMAPGSRKDRGYFSTVSPRVSTIVLCESAIDAISCFAIHPYWLCISTAGARPNPAWLPQLIEQGYKIYCGFDSDQAGENMAQAMIAKYPTIERLRPTLQDWNDVLKAR